MTTNQQLVRGNYIQGGFVRAKDPNGEILTKNPGNLEEPGIPVPYSYEHIQQAVVAARRSFTSWRRLAAGERKAHLQRYRDHYLERSKEIALCLSRETGRPLWDSQAEVLLTVSIMNDYLASVAPGMAEEKLIATDEGTPGVVRHFARGVFAIVVAPIPAVESFHATVFPALLSGNTVIVNPSPQTPLTGQLLAEVFHDSGFPPGVINVIQGEAEVARRLTCHSDVDGVFFSGSYEAGAKLYKQLASDPWKLVVLDLGGKNTIVVWDDCNYKKALHEALYSAFLSSGQRPTNADRILVHEKIFDRFMTDIHALAKKCRVGHSLTDGPDSAFLGPLMNETTLEDYLRFQGIAVREGAEEIMRGKALEKDKKGYYVSPSIHWVQSVDPKSIYQKSEIYGPDVALYKISDLDEVSEILGQSQYGLIASIYTANRENYIRLIDEARVSILHWNMPTVHANYRLPWGGLKKSGNCRYMGSAATRQCTFPVSSLEVGVDSASTPLPASMPQVG